MNPPAREALFVRAHFHSDLGRNDNLVPIAPGLHPVADQRLGFTALSTWRPARIDVRGIDHVEAPGDESVQEAESGLFVHRPAEHIATESDPTDAQFRLTQTSFFHQLNRLVVAAHLWLNQISNEGTLL